MKKPSENIKSLSSGKFRNAFKLSVISVFKCGDKQDVSNYRP